MALNRGVLDVLRIIIHPADDDDPLAAAGDVEHSLAQVSKIAGSQEAFAWLVGQSGLKGFECRFRLAPIPLAYASAVNPDFPDCIVAAPNARFRIDDGDVEWPGADLDKRHPVSRMRAGNDQPRPAELLPVNFKGGGVRIELGRADEYRCLRQSIGRAERAGTEAIAA